MDFSKAFDVVNHQLLLSKLHYFGFGANTVKWFENYLGNRFQSVRLHDEISNAIPVKRGVPQGSILGPMLFSIYTSDLYLSCNDCSILQFADDTQLYLSSSPALANVTVKRINEDLGRILAWSAKNGLILNPHKTVIMCLGSKLHRQTALNALNLDFCIDNSTIPISTHAKILGVWIDSYLTFEKHCNQLISNAYFKFKTFYKYKGLLYSNVKWKLCNALLLSPLNYCICVYFPFLSEFLKNKIQKLQNSCLRFSFHLNYREHITPHYNRLKILKFSNVYILLYNTFIFKLLKVRQPSYLVDLLKQRSQAHSLNLRHVNRFEIPIHQTSIFQCSFVYQATSFYNKYLQHYNKYKTTLSFKRQIKMALLESQLSNIS